MCRAEGVQTEDGWATPNERGRSRACGAARGATKKRQWRRPDPHFFDGGMARAKEEKSLRLFAEEILPAVLGDADPINPASRT